MQVFGHTYLNSLADMPLISLWYSVGNPPFRQHIAWSIDKGHHMCSEEVNFVSASHTLGTMHRYNLLCAKGSHVLQGAGGYP